jgi:hypothetical protein
MSLELPSGPLPRPTKGRFTAALINPSMTLVPNQTKREKFTRLPQRSKINRQNSRKLMSKLLIWRRE